MKNELLTACLDSNIYISAIAFSGKPLKVIERAFNRDFFLICSPVILEEVERNVVSKLDVSQNRLKQFISDIVSISSMYVPTGKLQVLPLHKYHGIIIEPPSMFLKRLDQNA